MFKKSQTRLEVIFIHWRKTEVIFLSDLKIINLIEATRGGGWRREEGERKRELRQYDIFQPPYHHSNTEWVSERETENFPALAPHIFI